MSEHTVNVDSISGQASTAGHGSVTPTADAGRVRLGGLSPVFKDVADAGKVRLGGLGPIFR